MAVFVPGKTLGGRVSSGSFNSGKKKGKSSFDIAAFLDALDKKKEEEDKKEEEERRRKKLAADLRSRG